jgi:hypothetical protein
MALNTTKAAMDYCKSARGLPSLSRQSLKQPAISHKLEKGSHVDRWGTLCMTKN